MVGAGTLNIVKFALSVISIVFDSIFLVQHYILYDDAWKKAQKEGYDAALAKENLELQEQKVIDENKLAASGAQEELRQVALKASNKEDDDNVPLL